MSKKDYNCKLEGSISPTVTLAHCEKYKIQMTGDKTVIGLKRTPP